MNIRMTERKLKKKKMMGSDVSPIEIVAMNDNDDDDVFFFTSSSMSCNGTNKRNAISVEQYSEDRDLNLAIMASLLQPGRVIDLSHDDDDDDVRVVETKATMTTPFGRRRKPFRVPEVGQSSNSSKTFMCEICIEPKPDNHSFSIKGCTHSYCSECIIKYVASKLQDNVTRIGCPVPNCRGVLEAEDCRLILPQEVFDRWGNALCESVILASHKFYCPFKDCSALLIDDGGEVIRQSECPNCRRMFCAQCKVAWHPGIGCDEFQKLNKDERGTEDIMMINLAKAKKWIRCPKCRFYVEKSEGCIYMKCRCGFAFCYSCGVHLKTHFCSKCKQ